MDAIRKHLKEAIEFTEMNQLSLNQTMRECLAEPNAINGTNAPRTNLSKSAISISREIEYDNMGKDNNVIKFIKSETKVLSYNDLEMNTILGYDVNAWSMLARRLDLINPVLTKKDLVEGHRAAETNTKSNASNFSVHFPLKEIHGEVKFTRGVFTIKQTKEYNLNDGMRNYTLLHGVDDQNNAILIRWITYETQDLNASFKPKIRECILLFNGSHQLNISKVVTPLSNGKEKLPSALSTEINEALKFDEKKYKTKFAANVHDPTLYFLRYQFPSQRYIESFGSDLGMFNEVDIHQFLQHSKQCVRDIAALHWAYSGLCAVLKSLNEPESKRILNGLNISFLDHDDMLLVIAYLAYLVTSEFTQLYSEGTATPFKLETIYSPYNATLSLVSGITVDVNKKEFIGYKLTQWLITNAEKATQVTAKSDTYTPISKTLKAHLKKVDCNISRTAIKTTYTTDILLDLNRKVYTDLWEQIYTGGYKDLPSKIKAYSIHATNKNLNWAKEGEFTDKKISITMNSTVLIRLTFHAFRRKFNGSDPVVASKAVEKAASSTEKKNQTRRSRKAVEKLVRPRKIKFNELLRRVNTGDETVPQKFVFGGGQPQSWSWS